MRKTETSDLWWKTAVFYCLDVETFFDSDNDGFGDFDGVSERIDYLAGLGVTCLWLMPFYPTAERDDGYDITDFCGVDPRVGSFGDVVELIRTAKDRGMRIIADLVVNHTSDKHPWFKEARKSKDNPYRDYYVWRDTEPPDTSDKVVFPDVEDSIWELDERTGEWYLHNFYKHQPDLNVTNPKVRDEISKIIGFWMQLGFDGFRVDAVPNLIETVGATAGAADTYGEPHDYLRQLKAFMGRRKGDAILLGEVNVPYAEQVKFFGGSDSGDELTMQFDFELMQQTYLALARGDAAPIEKTLERRPQLPEHNQFGVFLRNHDELTLDKLSDEERQEVFDAFGPDPDTQLFGRGLRRRVPPMLDGDPRRICMVYSLLFSLPGTPVLFYGEEIGMGENLDVPGRLAVRTPMQWTSDKNGGFSKAKPSQLPAAVTEGPFGPSHVNVSDQRRDPDSLLSFISRLAQGHRESPELGMGTFEILEHDAPAVLAHRCTWKHENEPGASTLLVHNLGPEATEITVTCEDLEEGARAYEMFSDASLTVGKGGKLTIPVDGYGHLWWRLHTSGGIRLP
ncbi:alpha-amylase family protein [Tessaracoccus sp. OS52]|uniref:alpha-amylase family protein n=1 Tax=Tessaracoccus sp. OS52 TaxID=2886691 RepID=UPI001D11499D|nr:alpha-amylase family protein [Tessaracoccus sp. OS52]MCC2593773.1 alpha-amylase family protein [Tessaracoccus sp. OS52]